LGATVTVALKPADSSKWQSYNVPIGALYETGQGTSVWVISNTDSTVSLRAVKILHLGEEYASISGNIQPGEHIVALGANLLKPGEKVRVNQNPGDEAL
jgi:multidrug efflux pump subunit AcrA (membrane-fusion protein)